VSAAFLVTNLHKDTELYAADLRTIKAVFPQVMLFETKGRGNVIACAVKYRTPDVTGVPDWAALAKANTGLAALMDLESLAGEKIAYPAKLAASARVLTDDFSPVEFLDALKTNNTKAR